jgi:hypothetical protein
VRGEARSKLGYLGTYLDTVVLEMIKIDHPYRLSTDQLVAEVKAIAALAGGFERPDQITGTDPRSTIARVLKVDEAQPAELGNRLRTQNASLVPGHQAREVNNFLNNHPGFEKTLSGQVGPTEIVFHSAQAKGLGGMYTHLDHVVHLENLNASSPDVFLRLLLHETGHATFQQLLLRQQLHTVWGSGEVYTLLLRRRQLLDELDGLNNQPPESAKDRRKGRYKDPLVVRVGQVTSELKAIEKKIADADVVGQWQRLTAEARRFYWAWLVLRRDNGTYLLGLDLGPGRRPADRQAYQAGTFQEFCAESFMLAATGALAGHVANLANDPQVPPIVLTAWRAAQTILNKYRALLMDG